MALNLIKKWFIKRTLLSDKDDTGVTKATALDLDAYIQHRIDNSPATLSYKVYTALLTQTGTDAPVATVLENTLGGAVTYGYSATGIYTINSSGLFTLNKTAVFGGIVAINGSVVALGITSGTMTDSIMYLENISGGDEFLLNTAIEIRVYP